MRTILAVMLVLAATTMRAEEIQVKSVAAIYRPETDDVLFRAVFDRSPSIPFWMVSWGMYDDGNPDIPNSGFTTVRVDRIESDAGVMLIRHFGSDWRVQSVSQADFLIQENIFSAVVPFRELDNSSKQFWYESYIIERPGDIGVYNSKYASIGVPEPSGLVLAIVGLVLIRPLAASAVQRTKPPTRQEFRAGIHRPMASPPSPTTPPRSTLLRRSAR